jgi:hypothetical protein
MTEGEVEIGPRKPTTVAWIDERLQTLRNIVRAVRRVFSWPWDRISHVGGIKAFKSSYFFLMLVPVLAKALAHLPPNVVLVLGHPVTIHLRLPFNWLVLFFCALSVTIGNVIYELFCPKIIKGFSDFSDFQRAGLDRRFLLSEIWSEIPHTTALPRTDIVRLLARKFPEYREFDLKDMVSELGGDGHLLPSRPVTGQTFHLVRNYLKHVRPFARGCATTAYMIGFTLLGVILLQNVRWVILYFLNQ